VPEALFASSVREKKEHMQGRLRGGPSWGLGIKLVTAGDLWDRGAFKAVFEEMERLR